MTLDDACYHLKKLTSHLRVDIAERITARVLRSLRPDFDGTYTTEELQMRWTNDVVRHVGDHKPPRSDTPEEPPRQALAVVPARRLSSPHTRGGKKIVRLKHAVPTNVHCWYNSPY